jgi:hypothetical protein
MRVQLGSKSKKRFEVTGETLQTFVISHKNLVPPEPFEWKTEGHVGLRRSRRQRRNEGPFLCKGNSIGEARRRALLEIAVRSASSSVASRESGSSADSCLPAVRSLT